MDKKTDILFGPSKNINSVAVDTYDSVLLENKRNNILEYDVRNILSVTEVFEAERQGTEVYRIYGGIEYLSLLNGVKDQYRLVSDFFTPYYCPEGETCTFRDIYDAFDFYLVRPYTGYTRAGTHSDPNRPYVRKFEVIATPDDFDMVDVGYSMNLFKNSKQSFSFTKDIDVAGMADEFGFPPTEIYLYAEYNPSTNGGGEPETMERRRWRSHGGSATTIAFAPVPLSVGDVIQGDKINYYRDTFLQTPYTPDGNAEYYVTTYVLTGTSTTWVPLRWKYNPFIPLKLRYFAEEIRNANISGSSYEDSANIPYYATDLGGGNYVWRNILPQGYIDPLTGDGVEYPFINKRRYLFDNIIVDIIPDLDDPVTADIFSEIKFGAPIILNYNTLNEDIEDIGQPCQ